ncbi:MAG: hypothetical protein WC058_00020 [Phycisphaeraceae bacterium]
MGQQEVDSISSHDSQLSETGSPSELSIAQTDKQKQPTQEEQELHALRALAQSLLPFVKDMVTTTAQETTKQTEIVAKTQRRIIYCATLLAGLIISVAICGLFLHEIALTEKIIVGLLGFLGGFGSAKAIKAEKQ